MASPEGRHRRSTSRMARSAIGEPYGVAKWHWRRMRRVALEAAWADDFFGRGRIRLGGAGGCDRMGAFGN